MLISTPEQILAFRRSRSALDGRLPPSKRSLQRVAAAGLQDSMPRAALLAIHARVEDTKADAWQRPPYVQVWGPRYSAYVIAERDRAVFTFGRLPESPKARQRAVDTADRIEAALDGERMDCRDAARIVGLDPNALRYAAPTGRVLISWDGARQPVIWSVPAPDDDPVEARKELARRYLRTFGPGSSDGFASWAGIRPPTARSAFDALSNEMVEVETPIGRGWILTEDETGLRAAKASHATRLLPSGDTYYLLQGKDRELLIPDEVNRSRLWTSRVWPGAVLHHGEIVGTWRRSKHKVAIDPWIALSRADRQAIEAEAVSLPIPGIAQDLVVTWE